MLRFLFPLDIQVCSVQNPIHFQIMVIIINIYSEISLPQSSGFGMIKSHMAVKEDVSIRFLKEE